MPSGGSPSSPSRRRLAVGGAQQRRQVPGADDRQPFLLEVQQRVRERGHLVAAEAEGEPVQALGDARRRMAVERVGAQAGAHLGHQRRGADPVAHHVADDERDAAAPEDERVVPVAADPAAADRRAVAGGEREPRHRRQGLGARLRCSISTTPRWWNSRARSIAVAARSAASWSRSASTGTKSRGVRRADVQHADHVALGQQRHAQQRADAALAQDRVEDVGVVDVGDRDRAPLGRDAAGEALAERDPHARLDLLLDALRRRRHQLARALLEQQEGRRVRVQDRRDAVQQRVEQLVERQVAERRVGDALDRLEHARRVVLALVHAARGRSPSRRGRRRTGAARRRRG